MVHTPIRTLMCVTRAILLPLKFMQLFDPPKGEEVQPYSMYTCYAMYPQVRCNSILHSRKRLAKVSIFTPIFRLFPLIPIFIHV